MKIRLMLDTVLYNQKPNCRKACATIKSDMRAKTCEMSIEEIVSKIQKGFAVVPGVLSGSTADSFIEQQLVMIDIDNEADENLAKKTNRDVSQLKESERTPLLTEREALKICKDNGLKPCFAYHTFSHTDAKPKFRLAFVMDKVIREKPKQELILKTIIELFDQADKGCYNVDRIFMGTNKQATIIDVNARIGMENIYRIYRPPVRTIRNTDGELEQLKQDFDLFGYMCNHNGDGYKKIGSGYMFRDCNLCGHHHDLVYYGDSNTFYCFHLGQGGTIID